MSERYFAIGDIHGEYDKLMALMENLEKNAGFTLEDPNQYLVQLGDRNDRGPDTYKVNEYFRNLAIKYPNQVHCLMGNHDAMLISAVQGRSDLMWWNGGNKTEQSYSKVTKIYGANGFGNSVKKSGHFGWLASLPLYFETPNYFFCHAPIPTAKYRGIDVDMDFRMDEHTLTWSYVHGVPEYEWVDRNPVPTEQDGQFYPGVGKLSIHGHIHGIYSIRVDNRSHYIIPGVRKYGNSILLDTGSGCVDDGYISCIALPEMLIYNSKGERYPVKDTPEDLITGG